MCSLFNNIKKAYTLTEVVIVMLIIAVVVAVSIRITKAKLDHITSYTYYAAYSVVRDVTSEMLNDFDSTKEEYTSAKEGLLSKLFFNRAYGEQDCLTVFTINAPGYPAQKKYCGRYSIVNAIDIFNYDEEYIKNNGMQSRSIDKYVFDKLDFLDEENLVGNYHVVSACKDVFKAKYPHATGCMWYASNNECLNSDDGDYSQYNNGACFGYGIGNDPEKNPMCDLSKFKYIIFYTEDYEECTPKSCAVGYKFDEKSCSCVRDETPDPTPDPTPTPDCTPTTCTGGNEFDNESCSCVCKKEPPANIPCGKEWSFEQCQLVDKAGFPPECPAGQVFDKSDDVCGCKPITPSIPLKGANYCKLFASYSNTAQLPTECSGSKVNAATAVFGGDDANVLPDLILRNGMVIYNASQNPTKIAALDGNSRGNIYTDADGNEYDLDEYGYTLYIDIDGERSGKGVLWEDVYPFYVTLSGMTIPAYNSDNIDMYGGGNKSYLQVSLLDEYTNNSGRHADWLLKSKSFRESACQSGYLKASSDYCSKSPALTTLAQCGQEGHDCRLKYVSPTSLIKR